MSGEVVNTLVGYLRLVGQMHNRKPDSSWSLLATREFVLTTRTEQNRVNAIVDACKHCRPEFSYLTDVLL